jgi:hypothetical protein
MGIGIHPGNDRPADNHPQIRRKEKIEQLGQGHHKIIHHKHFSHSSL